MTDKDTSHAPTPAGPQRLPPPVFPPKAHGRSALAIVGACLTLVGAALPWVGLGGWAGPTGLDGDGAIIGAIGLVGLAIAVVGPLGPWRRTVCVLLGLAIGLVATIDIANVQGTLFDIRSAGELGAAVGSVLHVGVGLYATAAGAAFILAGGLLGE